MQQHKDLTKFYSAENYSATSDFAISEYLPAHPAVRTKIIEIINIFVVVKQSYTCMFLIFIKIWGNDENKNVRGMWIEVEDSHF